MSEEDIDVTEIYEGWFGRLLQERDELLSKIESLTAALEERSELPKDSIPLLQKQLEAMVSYSSILLERIDAHADAVMKEFSLESNDNSPVVVAKDSSGTEFATVVLEQAAASQFKITVYDYTGDAVVDVRFHASGEVVDVQLGDSLPLTTEEFTQWDARFERAKNAFWRASRGIPTPALKAADTSTKKSAPKKKVNHGK